MNQKFFGKRTQTGPSWERTAQANCSRAKKGQSRAYWKTDNSKCYVLYRVDEVIFFFRLWEGGSNLKGRERLDRENRDLRAENQDLRRTDWELTKRLRIVNIA